MYAEIQTSSNFLCNYVTTLLGVGAHTSRVVRNVSRLAEALGYDIQMTIFQQHVTIHIVAKDDETQRRTSVRKIQHGAFNFEAISRLSSLSWSAIDDQLSFVEISEQYEKIVSKPRISRWVTLILVGCANTSFCRLFGGDLTAMALVFIATLVGFFLRQELTLKKVNHLVIYVLVAFIASFIAALGAYFNMGSTPNIAVAASVLFLIPGVQMINSILDVLEGHILMGFSRAATAVLAVICIAVGMVCSFYILGI